MARLKDWVVSTAISTVKGIKNFVVKTGQQFKSFVIKAWDASTEAIANAAIAAGEFIETTYNNVKYAIIKGVKGAADFVVKLS